MRVGISSLVAFKEDIENVMFFAQNNGFSHVNIFVSEPHFSLFKDRTYFKQLRRLAQNLGLLISLKAPAFTQNLSSIDNDIGRIAVKYYERIINIASILDSDKVIIRAGMVFYPEKLHPKETFQVTISRLIHILEKAKDNGIKLLIENYPYDFDMIRDIDDMLLIKKYLRKIAFAFNIPHLFALKRKNFDINKINYVDVDCFIMGPPPSPYHVPYNIRELENVIALYYDVVKIRRRELILASVRKDLILRIKSLISEK